MFEHPLVSAGGRPIVRRTLHVIPTEEPCFTLEAIISFDITDIDNRTIKMHIACMSRLALGVALPTVAVLITPKDDGKARSSGNTTTQQSIPTDETKSKTAS